MSRPIVYTGGTGRMGVEIRRRLHDVFTDVRLLVRDEAAEVFSGEVVVSGSLENFGEVSEAFNEAEVVVHLGAIADEAPFETLLESNILGTYNVFEAARRAGVRRVIYASSNHVTGFYPVSESLDGSSLPRPDSFYGVTKVFGEALGRLYHDKWGLEVVNLRIGTFREKPEDERQLSMWLSHRDGAELIRCAIVAPDVGYLTVYGCSANTRSWWELNDARESLGYRPVDNAEEFAQMILGPTGESDINVTTPQGGGFTESGYRGGLWTRPPE